MNETHQGAVLKVTAPDRAGMDTMLTQAEQTLREQAIRARRGGILITRETTPHSHSAHTDQAATSAQ